MNVWQLHIGEDIPGVDDSSRPFRCSYLAEAVLRRGGRVLRWAPTLRHTTKRQRSSRDTLVPIRPGYDVQLVRAPGYRRHIGLARARMYRVLARRFHELAERHDRPDAIVAAIPSLEWADAAIRYGRSHGVPVFVDVRDLWPDVFEQAAPAWLRPVARLAAGGYRRLARRVCRDADGIVGISPSYLRWGLDLAGREATARDFVAPIGYDAPQRSPQADAATAHRLRQLGYDDTAPTCCYMGLLGRYAGLETAIEAIRLLRPRGVNTQLIVCGDGYRRAELQRQAEDVPGVFFLGHVDGPTMGAVMARSKIGICGYSPGALMSWPNKPFQYMAGRLAVVSSLAGDLRRLLREHDCGLFYNASRPGELAATIDGLFRDQERLERLRGNAYRLWRARFHAPTVYDRFVARLPLVNAPEQSAA